MPAPTVPRLPSAPFQTDEAQNIPLPTTNDHDLDLVTETTPQTIPSQSSTSQTQDTDNDTAMSLDTEGHPHFPPSTTTTLSSTAPQTTIPKTTLLKLSHRKIPIPPHRMSPLKAHWSKIYPPLVEHLQLQVRMNLASKAVELRTSRHTPTTSTNGTTALQKGEDFLRAFCLGFDVDDAIALLRLDDLYIETFAIRDVKPSLNGDHLARAIGRIAGKDGKTKFAIENTTRTRIVLAESKVHILGGFKEGRVARESVVSLILGRPPGRVYGDLRAVAGRMKERF